MFLPEALSSLFKCISHKFKVGILFFLGFQVCVFQDFRWIFLLLNLFELNITIFFFTFRLNNVAKLTESYDHIFSEHKLLGKTIGQVLQETTERVPDTEAVVFHRDKRRATYAEFNKQVSKLLNNCFPAHPLVKYKKGREFFCNIS